MRFSILLLLVVSPLWSKRPNVVFLVSEDNSIHYLKHYGAKFGSMPNIEKMAEAGLTFNHAFSNAPVCSVARTTLTARVFFLVSLCFYLGFMLVVRDFPPHPKLQLRE